MTFADTLKQHSIPAQNMAHHGTTSINANTNPSSTIIKNKINYGENLNDSQPLRGGQNSLQSINDDERLPGGYSSSNLEDIPKESWHGRVK
jgi:hypothetical protein